jgi:hypothetical protein
MSTTRLTFLYPHLFRPAIVSDSAAITVRVRRQAPQIQCQHLRCFVSSERRTRQSAQRHGKAVEPYPIGGGSGGTEESKILASAIADKDAEKGRGQNDTTEMSKDSGRELSRNAGPGSSFETSSPDELQDTANASKLRGESTTEPASPQQPVANMSKPLAPLETVLQMPPPERQDQENGTKPLHLRTPPYVHHFDTYTLVQQVEAGDFTADQSITAMKAVRGLLARNLDVAKAGLVSKSDVENVSYCPSCHPLMLIHLSGELPLPGGLL